MSLQKRKFRVISDDDEEKTEEDSPPEVHTRLTDLKEEIFIPILRHLSRAEQLKLTCTSWKMRSLHAKWLRKENIGFARTLNFDDFRPPYRPFDSINFAADLLRLQARFLGTEMDREEAAFRWTMRLRLGRDYIQQLEFASTQSFPITALDLGANDIGVAGAQAVAEKLGSVPGLTTLDLRGNRIGAAGARAVAEKLGSVPGLTTLDLTANDIGDAGAQAVAEKLGSVPGLTTLDLRGNDIGAASEQAVAEELPQGTVLFD